MKAKTPTKTRAASKPKRSPVNATPNTPQCPGELTVDERDAINAAEQRAKDMLTLVMATLNEDDVLIVGGYSNDADRTGAVLTACEIILESLNAIDENFQAADERRIAATATTGGAQ